MWKFMILIVQLPRRGEYVAFLFGQPKNSNILYCKNSLIDWTANQ